MVERGIGYIIRVFHHIETEKYIILDENNKFIGFFSSGWAYIPLTLSFLLSMGTLLVYRNHNRPKGTYLNEDKMCKYTKEGEETYCF